ncbi:uncharacterized protein LOC130903999 [Diorhabda carinulata]|uniref:uncharacterized protein LOC130903999 n=1 Tax=Diorhabda carinulata TaxID=1163345 RepID=UPI0025A1212E|nr:uncharacterized protein LOC130903999 [Diorhabda carinulata]
MSEIRTFKEVENKIHEEMFNNIYLLKCTYKTSTDFEKVFKKDMFVKNNKAAFYEVVYYLLDILNSDLTKKKLPSWPPLEIKRDNKFRSELLKYINELNTIYNYANIPPLMSSHLISPGGFKIAKFLLILSRLVMFEHLKKTNLGLLLYCPIPNKDPNITQGMLNNINKLTSEIEIRTKEKIENFQKYQNDQKCAANMLVDKLAELDKKISIAKKELITKEEDFYKKYTLYPSMSSLRENFKAIKQEWKNISSINNIFLECKELTSTLSGNKLVVKHTFDDKQSTEGHELNLSEFFSEVATMINIKSLELPNPSSHFIEQKANILRSVIYECLQIQKNLDNDKEKVSSLIKHLFESLKYVDNINSLEFENDSLDDSSDDLGIKPFDASDD